MTLLHNSYSPIGSPGNCPAEYQNVVYIDDAPISLWYDGSQYMHEDSPFDVLVALDDIQSFTQTSGRGSVSMDGQSIYINDDSYGSGDVYTITVCGTPHVNEIPEFGLIAGGVAVIGALGVFLFLRK
ncbi:MAG: hypothetical protein V1743_06555, partial [Nanoarchaeota archaeon]